MTAAKQPSPRPAEHNQHSTNTTTMVTRSTTSNMATTRSQSLLQVSPSPIVPLTSNSSKYLGLRPRSRSGSMSPSYDSSSSVVSDRPGNTVTHRKSLDRSTNVSSVERNIQSPATVGLQLVRPDGPTVSTRSSSRATVVSAAANGRPVTERPFIPIVVSAPCQTTRSEPVTNTVPGHSSQLRDCGGTPIASPSQQQTRQAFQHQQHSSHHQPLSAPPPESQQHQQHSSHHQTLPTPLPASHQSTPYQTSRLQSIARASKNSRNMSDFS